MASTKASTRGLSLFPEHQKIVDAVARMLGLTGNTFSPAIQYILNDWAQLRGIDSHTHINAVNRGLVFVGYTHLSVLALTIDKNEPVYILNTLETSKGVGEGQRIDHHYVVVSQPDAQNRVHYCRIPVVQLTSLNGIPFAPDHDMQLAQVEQRRAEVWHWLEARSHKVRAAVVAVPNGFNLINGTFE